MEQATQEARPAWPPEYLDMTAVAHLLCTSRKQVQRMLASGRLPHADLNLSGTGGVKGRRWHRARLVAWLESQRP